MSIKYRFLTLALAVAALVLSGCETITPPVSESETPPPPDDGTPTKILGALELARFQELDFPLVARVDTGATTSSLDARNITSFERDGEQWVRFDVLDRKTEAKASLERPVVRIARIEQQGPDEKRFVVELTFILGEEEPVTAQFTLVSRRQFNFPVLIGRNILEGAYMVDVSTQFEYGKHKNGR